MNEPRTLRCGDTAKWTEAFSDYPASAGWVLKYRLLGSTNYAAILASADGDGFSVTFSATTTAGYLSGVYMLLGWVEKGTERYTISETTVLLTGNPATEGSGADQRSHVRKTLALIESAIESYAVRPVERIEIAGRVLFRPTIGQLLAFRSQYVFLVKQEVMKERAANGSDPGGSILVKFGGIR